MNKNSMINPQITFYIRTAKKIGFIQKSKKQILNQKQLKQLVEKKSKIPISNQILYYNGEQIKQNKNITIVDKSIIHVIDSRNVGRSKMKILVKRLPENSQTNDFEVDSNSSIDQFIKKQLEPYYQQPAEKLFFVYSGRQLKKQKSFKQEHVQTDTQLICVHQQKDRKNKRHQISSRSSANSLKTKDTLQTKLQDTPRKQQKVQQLKDSPNQSKDEIVSLQLLMQKTKVNNRKNSGESIKLQSKKQEKQQNIIQAKQQQLKNQKKIIKSIEEIQCGQIQSDEDSDNQLNEQQTNTYPKKLPQQFLMQQTRPRSHTKSSNNNNSQTSSISEPNFKKKKKVSEVQINKSAQRKQQQNSPKSNIQKESYQNSPILFDRIESAKQQKEPLQQSKSQQTLKYKTREQIFESNNRTYSLVVDQPQQTNQNILLSNGNGNNSDDIFKSYCNQQQNQIYDSQMNYYQTDKSKLQVKGFMNFSNASFLQSSKIQTLLNTQNQQDNQNESVRLTNNAQFKVENESGIRNNEGMQQISNRAPQFLHSGLLHNQTQQNLNVPRQSMQQLGDSLNFSKQQSQMKNQQQNQDNLFVEYRRGKQQKTKNINNEYEISQSNLLSQTYNNANTTFMNSLTFNLQPNPDQTNTYRQSNIKIITQEEQDENLKKDLQQNVQQNVVNDQKRQSQIQTNFKDSSANPSQIYSNPSQIIFNNQNTQHLNTQNNQQQFESHVQPLSLIQNLMSMMDYKINVNSIQSQQSDNQNQFNNKKNLVQVQSDISCHHDEDQQHKFNHQEYKKTIQNLYAPNQVPNPVSNLLLQDQSNVYVQYQSYRADTQSYPNQNQKYNLSKQQQSKYLEESSFGITNQKSLQGHYLKKTLGIDSQINVLQQYQNSAIKIVQQDSIVQAQQIRTAQTNQHQPQIQQSATFAINEQNSQCSGVFHQVSQSINDKIQQSSNFINNLQLMPNNQENNQQDITFRKDKTIMESRLDYGTQSKLQQPQGSKLLYQLSLQALNQTQKPQLLPGDYIYSTDKVQTPEQALDSILNNFSHCF